MGQCCSSAVSEPDKKFDDIKPPPDQRPAQDQKQPVVPPPRPVSPEQRKTLEEATEETEQLWVKHRADVDRHAKKMHELFDAASAAHKAGDGAKAKTLSTQGHAEQKAMQAAQAKAAQAIFTAKNKNQPPGTIDLHGLLVNEALHIVEEQINLAKKKGLKKLRIIVGAGHHSGPGGPKIRPAVEKWLTDHKMSWSEDADNASHGSLTVLL